MGGVSLNSGDVELVTIYEISKILSSSLNLEKGMYEVLNVLEAYLGLQRGMVSLLDDLGVLRIAAAIGLTGEERRFGQLAVGEGVIGQIVKTGVPAVVPDVAREPIYLHTTSSPEKAEGESISFIGVPIKASRHCFGVLNVERKYKSSVGFQRDIRFLSMVANLIGQTVRLHQAVEIDRSRLMEEKHRLQKELQGKYRPDSMVGQSKQMHEVFTEVDQAARGNSTIMLRGESGTGKEVIARAIHFASRRKDGPFIKVNCAALSDSLIESELFGHEKGSFTGALRDHKGRFEQADGGTLFLDEIGDVSPSFQAKLLRVLQEREFERVGGTKTIRVDVRLICATNRDLEEMVSKGQFRADLYYRINVVTIFLPPLRERREDIPDLVWHFLNKFNTANGRDLTISPEAMEVLKSCAWPGNVRELENCVERTALMVHGSTIVAQDVPCQRNQCLSTLLWRARIKPIDIPVVTSPTSPAAASPLGATHDDAGVAAADSGQADTQRERLVKAMEKAGWVQAKAARMLNLTPRQMGYALKKHGIEVRRF
jgi:Nif-specific regulatory protein